jgi:copper chaperone
MKKEKLTIEGMSCNHCVMALKKELTNNDITVLEAGIGFANVEFDEKNVSAEKVNSAISEAGFRLVKTEQSA